MTERKPPLGVTLRAEDSLQIAGAILGMQSLLAQILAHMPARPDIVEEALKLGDDPERRVGGGAHRIRAMEEYARQTVKNIGESAVPIAS